MEEFKVEFKNKKISSENDKTVDIIFEFKVF